MQDIGAPAGCSSEGRDINDAGVVVGFMTCSGITRAFRWTESTGRVDVGVPDSQWQLSRAVGVNENGDIALLLERCYGCSSTNYLKTAAGTWFLIPGQFGRTFRIADLNNDQLFVGVANNGFYEFGVRWSLEPNSAMGCHLGSANLGSSADDINEAGDFVGAAIEPASNASRAILCTGLGLPAVQALSPVTGFTDSSAHGINNGAAAVYVVGESWNSPNGQRARATLWVVR